MANAALQIDSKFDIVTPENIAFEYQVAGPWRRLPAFLIDFVIRASVYCAAFIVLMCAGALTFSMAGVFAAFGAMLLVWFLFDWFYGGLFETFWNGQTPGKRAMGLRVLTTAGEPINGLQAIMRNILRFVDAMPAIPFAAFATIFLWDPHSLPAEDDPFALLWLLFRVATPVPTFMVAVLVSAFNQRRQRLGDLVCGTIVIVEEMNWLHGMIRMQDRNVIELASQLPPHMDVPRGTARALAMYVERRKRYSPARRQEIAMHLGRPLIERYHLPPASDHDRLLCAIYYKVFFSEQLQQEMEALPVAATELHATESLSADPDSIEEAPEIIL